MRCSKLIPAVLVLSVACGRIATETPSAVRTSIGDEHFALIPAGTFQMGSTNGWPYEQPVHTVNITEPFYIQKTAVTLGQWRAVMGSNPGNLTVSHICGDECPVTMVSWDEVQTFISTLNARHPGKNHRLPTEAEWEYAARAGTTGDYGGTGILDEMGWHAGNSRRIDRPDRQERLPEAVRQGRGFVEAIRPQHPVAQKQPNGWGLYDMHGSVWEWVQDWYSESYYSVSPSDNPIGPNTGTYRVLRGGSWRASGGFARSAFRSHAPPTWRAHDRGFRLARTP